MGRPRDRRLTVAGGLGPLPPGQPRDVLCATVADGLRSLPAGAAAVVALSGGPDSTALAYLAAEVRPDLELTLVHVRHGLRDDRHDLEVVATHAAWLGRRLEVREVRVGTAGGPSAAARRARYAALREVAAEVAAAAILLGHHADDQAETVLLRAARGSGTAGLAAMATVAGDLVRPLLRLRRADLERFVALEGLPVAHDPTNDDVARPRGAARHALLPALEGLAPDPVGALGRLAELAARDDAALDAWARSVVADALRRVGPVRSVPDEALRALPHAVAARVVQAMAAEVAGAAPRPLDAARIDAVLALARGRQRDLPGGLRAAAAGGWRTIAPRRLEPAAPVELTVPGRTPWPPAGVTVLARTAQEHDEPPAETGQVAFALIGAWTPPAVRPDPRAVPPGGHPGRRAVVLPADLPPLRLRHRRPGDRVAAAAGTVRLQDRFVDAGVPRAVRDRWPVVATAEGRVVWVPGLVVDAELAAAGRAAPGVQLVCEVDRRGPAR